MWCKLCGAAYVVRYARCNIRSAMYRYIHMWCNLCGESGVVQSAWWKNEEDEAEEEAGVGRCSDLPLPCYIDRFRNPTLALMRASTSKPLPPSAVGHHKLTPRGAKRAACRGERIACKFTRFKLTASAQGSDPDPHGGGKDRWSCGTAGRGLAACRTSTASTVRVYVCMCVCVCVRVGVCAHTHEARAVIDDPIVWQAAIVCTHMCAREEAGSHPRERRCAQK